MPRLKRKLLKFLPFLIVIGTVTFSSIATAQNNLVDGSIRGDRGGPMVQLDATFGYSQIEEDDFLRFDTGLAMQIGALAFGIHAPVHFRIVDAEPTSEGVVREEDWDEVGDFFRIVRFIQWGEREKPDPVFIRAGELVDVSLGHRSVVDRYYNVVDTNHHKLGIQGEVELNYGGIEFFLDNIAPTEILGFRSYIRPFTFFESADLLKRMSTGLTYVTDFAAPMRLDLPTGNSDQELTAATTSMVSLYGWDIDWSIVETELIEWVPYFDFMAQDSAGFGLHGGQFINLHFSDSLALNTQLEWRYASKGYQPGYFSSLYEIEKWSFAGASGARGPKLNQVRRDPNRQDRQGIYGGIDLHFSNYLSIGGTYEDYEGPNNSNLMLRVQTPYITWVKTGLFYAKRNFEGSDELLRLRDTLLISQTRIQVFGPLFVSAEYAHTFRESQGTGYSPTHNTHFGVGAEFTF